VAGDRRAATEVNVLHRLPASLRAFEKIPHVFERALVILVESLHLRCGCFPAVPISTSGSFLCAAMNWSLVSLGQLSSGYP